MSLNLNDLRNACSSVAKSRAALNGRGLTTPITASVLTELFYEIAADHAMEFFDLGRDPKLVNRAVWFLSQVKTATPLGKEPVWFQSCLDLLLEMASPETDVVEKSQSDFLGHLYSRFNTADKEEVWG